MSYNAGVRVGLCVQGQEGVAWAKWLALAEAAEEAQLDSLFCSDHYRWLIGNHDGARDAWTVLAALATCTATVRLGTLVSPVTFRHPSLLARIVATVDEISGGRAELGLGAGWHAPEHREHGFDFPPLRERLERVAEQAEIVTRAWSGARFDFGGKHYRLEGCQARPVPAAKPNLIVGGTAKPGTIAPAVAFADEYNTSFCSVEECRARRAAVDAACTAAGRAPLTFSLMMSCVTAPDTAELARRRLRFEDVVGRAIDPERTIVGTFDEVADTLRAYADAGVDRIFLQDNSLHPESVAAFGELARTVNTWQAI